MILGEIPSYPVAFLMFNLFICLVTKSSFIGLKNRKLEESFGDDNKCIAAILMDLSKAFDCLPHNLLMLKLEAYGLSDNFLLFYVMPSDTQNLI
jgi:hypothetical protein